MNTQRTSNNAINTDSKKRRSFVASLLVPVMANVRPRGGTDGFHHHVAGISWPVMVVKPDSEALNLDAIESQGCH